MISGNAYDLFYGENTVDKQITISVVEDGITLTNTDLYQNGITINESLCSAESLVIGSCESSSITFKIANNVNNLKGKTIVVSELLNNTEYLPIGTYKIYSDEVSSNRNYRDVTGYDVMYDIINADVSEWYNGLTFPMTLKDFRDSFCAYVGVLQRVDNLVNDDIQIEKTIEVSKLSGKTVITAICESNGVFGHITRDNQLRYISLSAIATTLNKGIVVDYGGYEDWEVKPITKVTIKEDTDDIGNSYGVEGNEYIIMNNFLLYGHEEDTSIPQKILSQIDNIVYTPCDITLVGNPCLEVGDFIEVPLRNKTIATYVLKRQLVGVQSLRDSIEADGTEEVEVVVNSISDDIKQTVGKVNILSRTVDATVSELKDFEEDTNSRFDQTPEMIHTEVTKQISNIEVGTKNLIINSIDFEGHYFVSEDIFLSANGYSLTADGVNITI